MNVDCIDNKRKRIFRLIFILILIIIFINIFFLNKFSKTQDLEDILFLKLLSNRNFNKNSSEKNNKYNDKLKRIKYSTNEYGFKVRYKNMDLKKIDLLNTLNKETLIYDKIAPGTSGSFDILLSSNQKLNYKIEFYSVNEKPRNLKFKAFKDGTLKGEAYTLEELSNKLSGNINKNQRINITINWYWDFENKTNQEFSDIQDTKDAENIKTYEFNICTIGGDKY